MLLTPALMLDPKAIWDEYGAEKLTARKAYEKYFAEHLPGAELNNFFAAQELAGGYMSRRYRAYGADKYFPFLLTKAGSIFRFKGKFDPGLLGDLLARGLPLPALEGAAQPLTWKNCPYVRENGYGHFTMNSSRRFQRPLISSRSHPRLSEEVAMSGQGHEISRLYRGEIEVLSALHIGSGEFGERAGVEGKADAETKPLVGLIVRDVRNSPYIPGTTLKGLLRRLMICDEDRDFLAGKIKTSSPDDETDNGRMGALQVRGARLVSPGKADDLPFAHVVDPGEVGTGVFIAARTAIDPNSGVADDGKLFFQEMVAPGAVFQLRFSLRRVARANSTWPAGSSNRRSPP